MDKVIQPYQKMYLYLKLFVSNIHFELWLCVAVLCDLGVTLVIIVDLVCH